MTERVVVVGAGMVGHRFVEELVARDRAGRFEIELVGAEEYEPYNRIMLTEVLARRSDLTALSLPRTADRVRVRRGQRAVGVCREEGTVTLEDGSVLGYDTLVLATGATAFVPPVPGLADPPGHVHALRTIDDCREVVARTVNARHAVVLGGGVLGVEAACGLARRGLAVTLVHLEDHLMSESIDAPAGRVLADALADLDVRVHTSISVAEVVAAYDELVAVRLTDGTVLATDLMLVSCGVRPDIALAVGAGLPTGRGILVREDLASPADPRVRAIGDCAEGPDGWTGLVGPGWVQAARLATALAQGCANGTGHPPGGEDPAVRLKAAGVSLVTRGVRASTATGADRVLTLSDPAARRHVEVAVRGGVIAGFTALGAAPVASSLEAMMDRGTPLPPDPAVLLLSEAALDAPAEASPTLLPADAAICRCNGVTKEALVQAWGQGHRTVPELVTATRATTGCGGCKDAVCGVVDWLTRSDGGTESSAQHPRNTGHPGVSGRKHETVPAEMHRS